MFAAFPTPVCFAANSPGATIEGMGFLAIVSVITRSKAA
jgi:hypothetical protein